MSNIDFESGSVQSYLSILQEVINRMATNSASSKTWCITIVSAIIVITADKDNPCYLWVAIIPIILFLFLDAYYLGLEQRFRELYNEFIKKLHSNVAKIEDVFIVNPGGGIIVTFKSTFKAMLSLSIWPFYILLIAMLFIISKFIF